jgi:hypothetical protein
MIKAVTFGGAASVAMASGCPDATAFRLAHARLSG